MWCKSQLQILKNHLEFVLVLPTKALYFFFSQIASDFCNNSEYHELSDFINFSLSNFLKLSLVFEFCEDPKTLQWKSVQIFSWLNALRINSCIKSILNISRIFSHCLNSAMFNAYSDLVKYHFVLSNFHPSK